MNSHSHYTVSHPRFCSAQTFWINTQLRPTKRPASLVTKDKRGGNRYYMEENVSAVKRPRKRKDGALIREYTGTRLVRVDRDGERLGRARNMEPGVTGKSYRRRMKKELRAEKAAS